MCVVVLVWCGLYFGFVLVRCVVLARVMLCVVVIVVCCVWVWRLCVVGVVLAFGVYGVFQFWFGLWCIALYCSCYGSR